MERLIKYIAITSFLVLILDFGSSLFLNKLYQSNRVGESGGVLNYYMENESRTDLLILGSSRAHRHVIPDSFYCNAFNLSHHGFRIPFSAGVLDILKQKEKLTQVVLVHLELNSFCYHKQDGLKDSELRNLNYFYGKNKFVTNHIQQLSSGEKYKYFFQSYRYNGKVPSLISNFLETRNLKEHNGFKGLNVNLSDSLRIEKQINIRNSLNFNPDASEFQLSQRGIDYLSHVINLFAQSDSRLIFFSSPRFLVNTKGEEVSKEFLSRFLKEKEIPYLDYTNHRIKELQDKKYWRDVEHMNLDGAKLFTPKLRSDLELLINDSCFINSNE